MQEQHPMIYLARHGETAWTLSGQYTGVTDLALTVRGEHNASRLGERIRSVKFSNVFTSPLRRAVRTCELAGFIARAAIDHDLVEWNYGDYDGKTIVQIQQKLPNWELFRDGCPNGESVGDVVVRAEHVIERLQDLTGNTLIFSSSHFLRVLTTCWLNLDPTSGQHFYLGTAALSIIGYNHGLTDPVLRLWNDCGHQLDDNQ